MVKDNSNAAGSTLLYSKQPDGLGGGGGHLLATREDTEDQGHEGQQGHAEPEVGHVVLPLDLGESFCRADSPKEEREEGVGGRGEVSLLRRHETLRSIQLFDSAPKPVAAVSVVLVSPRRSERNQDMVLSSVPHLQKVYVIIGVGELIQSDLFLQAVQQYLRPCHGGLFVGADHLLDFVVLPLDGKQKLREDTLVLLKSGLGRVLSSSRDDVVVFVFIHHAQNTHQCLIRRRKEYSCSAVLLFDKSRQWALLRGVLSAPRR
ncbi:hypothetical protein EYF80_014469 [Liparis tanakae]|uniref:Uncharacterized protein n=1 Tax=Liparis tanakae TaxID=230148 RepID=A0A4Z2ICT1_9TELE|nr:hypothetical protein EYF80_014469 [Liparis tanakae]